MHDGTSDQMQVTFPASETYVPIGRVAAAGLAGRLRIDAAIVENLRLAVDEAVISLQGPGRIKLVALWQPGQLSISLENPETTLSPTTAFELENRLIERVTKAEVASNQICILLLDETPLATSETSGTL